MKDTFYKIDMEKQLKIIDACIDEFGINGYEKSSMDRLIRKAGISKGGLYEYISSKEELFLYTVEFSYKKLYDYIYIRAVKQGLPGDLLERFWQVSSIAIDFYAENPHYIRMISTANRIKNVDLEKKIKKIFLDRFMKIFGDTDTENLMYDRERLLDLFIWLLAKTREDFLKSTLKNSDIKKLKKVYLDDWEFYLSVFRTGIYK